MKGAVPFFAISGDFSVLILTTIYYRRSEDCVSNPVVLLEPHVPSITPYRSDIAFVIPAVSLMVYSIHGGLFIVGVDQWSTGPKLER